ncbi:MAG: DNA alkylation repair protein [Parcubacteria group bacterium GW2011_GWA2_38_13b]|nr:MAG: DNA alkylation repair protein [Parcubacteria group bacterium GW2011_GWA2_38_13b]
MWSTILNKLKSLANPENARGMARFGIKPKNAYGISIPNLRKIAKETGKNHELAGKLWTSGIHEAKILASMIDDPLLTTARQMDKWIRDFDSWDICDEVCLNLFVKIPCSYEKAMEWTAKKKEFEKRAGFALMATLAWRDKNAENKKFLSFLPLIEKMATDERNYVKKAVNWALRQIGKRNKILKKEAVKTAKKIQKINSKSAKWIAKNAIWELNNKKLK